MRDTIDTGGNWIDNRSKSNTLSGSLDHLDLYYQVARHDQEAHWVHKGGTARKIA